MLHLRLAQVFRRVLGEGTIAWLGRDEWLATVRRCESVDRLAGLEAMRAYRLFKAGKQVDADLGEYLGAFDLILNSLAPAGAPAARRLDGLAQHGAVTYDTSPSEGSGEHIVRQWVERIAGRLADVPGMAGPLVEVTQHLLDDPDILLYATPDDVAEASAALPNARDGKNRLVLVHPGSGGRRKCWPMDKFLRLTEILTDRDWQLVVVAGPAEVERMGERLADLQRRCCLILEPSLGQLMGMAASAAAYVGNDSGPAHLAAAMGVSTVALFGPTDPRVWRPIGSRVHVMQSQHSDTGWTDLPAERVAEQVETLAT